MRKRQPRQLNSAINVTPFVDVMLVLLVVFIISAPLMTSRLDLQLPDSQQTSQNESKDSVTISIDKSGHLFCAQKPIVMTKLLEMLSTLHKNNPKLQCFIEAHKTLAYHKVLSILDQISCLGISNVSLITHNTHR